MLIARGVLYQSSSIVALKEFLPIELGKEVDLPPCIKVGNDLIVLPEGPRNTYHH